MRMLKHAHLAGSGLSDGETISLGFYEQDDLMAVIEYLRASGLVSRIGLWGRSMGAATSVLVAARDPSIAGMVLDSAFSSLTQVSIFPPPQCLASVQRALGTQARSGEAQHTEATG